MKKIKYVIVLAALSFLLTGCVKFNANMEIKKDKSMRFSIIYAFNKSLFNNQEILTDENKKELENKGFIISDYADDTMKGFTISKDIKNIDAISSTDDINYSLSGLLDESVENKYFFKVKKGFLKNVYTATFNFDTQDSGLDDSFDLNNDSDTSDSSFGDVDFSGITQSMLQNLDLSFNVSLPYKALSNNASTATDNDKSLSWNLTANKKENIEFEFELYNMNVIYIGIGILFLIVIIIIGIVISKKKKNNNIQF